MNSDSLLYMMLGNFTLTGKTINGALKLTTEYMDIPEEELRIIQYGYCTLSHKRDMDQEGD